MNETKNFKGKLTPLRYREAILTTALSQPPGSPPGASDSLIGAENFMSEIVSPNDWTARLGALVCDIFQIIIGPSDKDCERALQR